MEATEKVIAKKNRIWEIDFLRGLFMLMMIVDHSLIIIDYAFYNWKGSFLNSIFIYSTTWYKSELRTAIHPIALFFFFFISGVSTAFSKKPLSSTLKLVVASLSYNLITMFLADILNRPSVIIYFGILNCFAFTRLCYCAVYYPIHFIASKLKKRKKLLARKASFLESHRMDIILVSILLIMSLVSVSIGNYLSGLRTIDRTTDNAWLYFIYMPKKPTMDYFPIFPYSGYFLIGVAFGRVVYPTRQSLLPYNTNNIFGKTFSAIISPFRFIGKYSLWVYVTHIGILVILMSIFSLIFGLGLPEF